MPTRPENVPPSQPAACATFGTVVKLDRGYPLVRLDSGAEIRCEHATALVKGAEVRAVIGDRVQIDVPAGHDKGIILDIAERRTRFVRRDPADRTASQVLAANFDLVIIAEPLVQLNVKRLERELVLAHETAARVAVVLTKSDLVGAGEAAERLAEASDLAGRSVQVLSVSLSDKASIQRVRDLILPGEVAILIGKSGVGKSSLVNVLAGAALQGTAAVRARDGKGRHTTVDRVMIDLPTAPPRPAASAGAASPDDLASSDSPVNPGNTAVLTNPADSIAETGFQSEPAVGPGARTGVLPARIVDMPGVRGLGLWDADQGLSAAFADVEELARNCRFRDCSHADEPGCAVQAAVTAGDLAESRLESYRGLARELAETRARRDEARHLRGEKASDRRRPGEKPTARRHRR